MDMPTTRLIPRGNGLIFNPNDFNINNNDIIKSIYDLHDKYEQHINELKSQINKLNDLVHELQKINIRVDDKTTIICNEIQEIKENT